MTPTRLLLAAAAASTLVAFTRPEAPRPLPAEDAKALYMEHCARCHGETGDGKGSETLERPARSFLLGG